MLQNYNIASTDTDAKVQLLEKLLDNYLKTKISVFEDINLACDAAKRLEVIGLGKSILNSVKYIEVLIDTETRSDRPNKAERLEQLRHFR